VYEFRTISAKTVADRLRFIAAQEAIGAPDQALMLLARSGEGSMRDSLGALDQVRAFAGDDISVDDVVTVLGLVGRDLVLDVLEATVAEDAPAAFALVERAIERGYDLRLLCRELARATRDLLVLSVDPARASDADVAAETERERLLGLSGQSSREDLLRAFDLLTRAEEEIRLSDQPRYNLEMALMRLMHLRKLTPLADLIAQADRGGPTGGAAAPATGRGGPSRQPAGAPTAPRVGAPLDSAQDRAVPPSVSGRGDGGVASAATKPSTKDAFLAEIKASKVFFYNTVVAAAYRVDVTPERVTLAFLPNQKVPRQQAEGARAWLEDLAERVSGRRIPVVVAVADAPAGTPSPAPAAEPASEEDLRKEALSDPTVQALFEIFPVERSKVEER
jgi:DNA polymerase-3 subunit gamma/tau